MRTRDTPRNESRPNPRTQDQRYRKNPNNTDTWYPDAISRQEEEIIRKAKADAKKIRRRKMPPYSPPTTPTSPLPSERIPNSPETERKLEQLFRDAKAAKTDEQTAQCVFELMAAYAKTPEGKREQEEENRRCQEKVMTQAIARKKGIIEDLIELQNRVADDLSNLHPTLPETELQERAEKIIGPLPCPLLEPIASATPQHPPQTTTGTECDPPTQNIPKGTESDHTMCEEQDNKQTGTECDPKEVINQNSNDKQSSETDTPCNDTTMSKQTTELAQTVRITARAANANPPPNAMILDSGATRTLVTKSSSLTSLESPGPITIEGVARQPLPIVSKGNLNPFTRSAFLMKSLEQGLLSLADVIHYMQDGITKQVIFTKHGAYIRPHQQLEPSWDDQIATHSKPHSAWYINGNWMQSHRDSSWKGHARIVDVIDPHHSRLLHERYFHRNLYPDRKSTRLNSSHSSVSRMPSSA